MAFGDLNIWNKYNIHIKQETKTVDYCRSFRTSKKKPLIETRVFEILGFSFSGNDKIRFMMTEFDRQIGFSATRSPFNFNLSMRWFKNIMLLLDDLDIDSFLAATGTNEDRQ